MPRLQHNNDIMVCDVNRFHSHFINLCATATDYWLLMLPRHGVDQTEALRKVTLNKIRPAGEVRGSGHVYVSTYYVRDWLSIFRHPAHRDPLNIRIYEYVMGLQLAVCPRGGVCSVHGNSLVERFI